jgi:hypothetical protein
MEFAIPTAGRAPDLGAIERELCALDPAALIDLDASGQTIRISASTTDGELLACLRRAGLAVAADEVTRLPSVCCGGCGG